MKRLIVGIVLVAILGVVAYIMTEFQSDSTIRTELNDFAFADTASVTKITLKNERGQTILLERKTASDWTVDHEYKARPDAIKNLLSTIKRVRVKAPISQNAMQTILKNIIAQHVLVEVYTDGDDPVKAYYVGGANQSHTGTNMMMKNSTRPFVVHIEGFHGFLTPRYFTNALEWRSREIFNYSQNDISEVDVVHHEFPEFNFKVLNNGAGNYQLFKGENLDIEAGFDTLLVSGYLSNYKKIHYESYEEVKPQSFIDSVKQSPPMFTIALSTDKENRIVHGYRKPLPNGYDLEGNPIKYDQDRLYLWVDSNELFVGQYIIFDKLTRGLHLFENSVEN